MDLSLEFRSIKFGVLCVEFESNWLSLLKVPSDPKRVSVSIEDTGEFINMDALGVEEQVQISRLMDIEINKNGEEMYHQKQVAMDEQEYQEHKYDNK